MTLAVQRAVIRILQQPDTNQALSTVEISHCSEDAEKHGLHNLFGLARIAHNSQRYVKHQTMITVEKNRKSLVTSSSEKFNQILVGGSRDTAIEELARICSDHLDRFSS